MTQTRNMTVGDGKKVSDEEGAEAGSPGMMLRSKRGKGPLVLDFQKQYKKNAVDQ